jgi:hypothetical protein
MTKVFCDSEDDLKLLSFNKRLRNLTKKKEPEIALTISQL